MTDQSNREAQMIAEWTRSALDATIEEACEQAGVVPLPWQSMASLMATREAVKRVLTSRHEHGKEIETHRRAVGADQESPT